jgi:Xaa-Pro aminopeptidase
VPAFQAAFCVVDGGRARRFVTDRAIDDGDLVAMRAGALVDGWEGSLARTLACGDAWSSRESEFRGWHTSWPPLVDRCRPGARVGDLRAAHGVTLHGVGLGFEGLADDDALEPGMVVELELDVDGIVGADMLLVTADAPDVLTGSG